MTLGALAGYVHPPVADSSSPPPTASAPNVVFVPVRPEPQAEQPAPKVDVVYANEEKPAPRRHHHEHDEEDENDDD
jgi:hypothetical protein